MPTWHDMLDINMRGVSAIILGVCGNYVGETLNCGLRKTLTENMVAKHLIVFFIIFVALEATNSFGKKFLEADGTVKGKSPPIHMILYSLELYITFVLLSKTTTKMSTFILGLLFVMYFIYIALSYHTHDPIVKERYTKVFIFLFILLYIFIFIGVAQYLKKQKRDYGKDFSYKVFFLGKPTCKSFE